MLNVYLSDPLLTCTVIFDWLVKYELAFAWAMTWCAFIIKSRIPDSPLNNIACALTEYGMTFKCDTTY